MNNRPIPKSSQVGSNRYNNLKVTIPAGDFISDSVDLSGTKLVGIITPEGDPQTLAVFFDVSWLEDDGSQFPFFNAMVNPAGEFIYCLARFQRYIAIDPVVFEGVRFLRLVGSVSTPEIEDQVYRLVTVPA